jgi:hypothetical protein
VWLAGAAAPNSQKIVVDGELPKSAKSILDLRIQKIDLSAISMHAALGTIADAIEASSHRQIHFSFSVEFAKPEVDEYVRKRIPEAKWKLRDPRVEIHAANTTLRNVVQRLCDQSGWSYKSTPIGIAFIDDRSYFERKLHKGREPQAR